MPERVYYLHGDPIASSAISLKRPPTGINRFDPGTLKVSVVILQESLRKINTFADILYEKHRDAFDGESKKYFDKIIKTSSQMTQYLKDLLNLSKLNNMAVWESVDLNSTIQQILNDLELRIAQEKASVEIRDSLPIIHAIPFHVKQLFYNLVNNALKFRRPDIAPHIKISCRMLTKAELLNYPSLSFEKVYCEVCINDNGIGFEQKYSRQIFTIFQRLHVKSAYEGTGMGLALCKKVVTILQGEIYATSSPNLGSTFHVILPISSN